MGIYKDRSDKYISAAMAVEITALVAGVLSAGFLGFAFAILPGIPPLFLSLYRGWDFTESPESFIGMLYGMALICMLPESGIAMGLSAIAAVLLGRGIMWGKV
jgi:hypothetical protein